MVAPMLRLPEQTDNATDSILLLAFAQFVFTVINTVMLAVVLWRSWPLT